MVFIATSLAWSFAIGVAGVINIIAIGWATVVVGQVLDMKRGNLDKEDEAVIFFAKLIYENYFEKTPD